MDTKQQEAEIISVQIITSFLFILTIFVSIFLNINERNILLNKNTFFTKKEASNLLKINRIVVVTLFFIYLFLSYKSREIDKMNNKDLTPDNLEILVSTLSVISGLIILYLVFNYSDDTSAIYENPTL